MNAKRAMPPSNLRSLQAATGLDVIDNVTDAVTWANNFIARTVAQRS